MENSLICVPRITVEANASTVSTNELSTIQLETLRQIGGAPEFDVPFFWLRKWQETSGIDLLSIKVAMNMLRQKNLITITTAYDMDCEEVTMRITDQGWRLLDATS